MWLYASTVFEIKSTKYLNHIYCNIVVSDLFGVLHIFFPVKENKKRAYRLRIIRERMKRIIVWKTDDSRVCVCFIYFPWLDSPVGGGCIMLVLAVDVVMVFPNTDSKPLFFRKNSTTEFRSIPLRVGGWEVWLPPAATARRRWLE